MKHGTIGFKKRSETPAGEGFNELLAKTQPKDLIHFGLIPELVGRLPVLTTLSELDLDSMKEILLKPKNSLIKQYQKIFEMENIKLTFTEDSIESISRLALERYSGARGLRSVMEGFMLEIMFELPSKTNIKECIINKDVVLNNAEPEFIKNNSCKQAS